MNIGIIGYGGMGAYHHTSIPKCDGIAFTAVYDINPEKVKKGEAAGLKPYYQLEDFLSDSSLDIVLIATPNNFHKDLTIKALKAGKNVICEKPVALNPAELLEMTAAARECRKMFTVHQNRRWDEDYLSVKKTLADGMIGKPFYIESRVQSANGIPGDWRCSPAAGGGMMYDWGVHLIDQMLQLVESPVVEIYCQLLKIKYEVDDNFKLLMKFENGLSALVEVDTYCFKPLPRWHVSGDSGTLVLGGWGERGRVTRAKTRRINFEPQIVYTAAGPTRTMAPRPVETTEELEAPQNNAPANVYYRNIYNHLTNGEELLVKPESCLRVLKVIEAAFRSSEQGVCIKCRI